MENQKNPKFLECRNHKTTQRNVLNIAGFANEKIAVHVGGKVVLDDILAVTFREEGTMISPIEDRIYDAIGTLYNSKKDLSTLNGMIEITGREILKLAFNTKNPNISQIEMLENSVYKLSTTQIVIDVNEQLKQKKNKLKLELLEDLNIEKGMIYKKFMLYAEVAYRKNDSTSLTIKILKEPLLYQYSRVFNQFRNYPIEFLNSRLRISENTVAIESYILKRLSLYKKLGKRILYDTFIKECGFNNIAHKSQKQRIKKYLIDELDFLKSSNAIISYDIVKNTNGSIYAIDLNINIKKEDN